MSKKNEGSNIYSLLLTILDDLNGYQRNIEQYGIIADYPKTTFRSPLL
jgi:hypothetical protein